MRIVFYFILISCLTSLIDTSWNISRNGFLLNAYKYYSVRSADYFSIAFWTQNHNGLLLVAFGNDNYLIVELYHSVIRLSVKYIDQARQEPFVGYIGSGLADNQPHQVEIYRESHSILLVLDRGTATPLAAWPVVSDNELNFKINRVYLGGYNDYSEFTRYMSLSQTGFVGCIEEATWNNINLLYMAYSNNSVSYCQPSSFTPMSFVNPTSFLMLHRKDHITGLSLVFDILLYLNYTTILYEHDNFSTLNVSILNGSFFMSLDFGNVNYINAFLPMIQINDGFWHRIAIQLPGKNSLEQPIVVFGVDDEIVTSPSTFTYDIKRDFKFGGFGFIGCINNLVLDGEKYYLSSSIKSHAVVENGCRFPDQCVPNPCQHSGFCTLKNLGFSCQCSSNYPGSVCNDAYYYMSCSDMYSCGYKESHNQIIDVDGTGPFDPVPVVCSNMDGPSFTIATTEVNTLLPNGEITLKNEPITVTVPYALTADQLKLLVMNSFYCTQQVTYECSSSRITDGNVTLLVWTGGDGLVHEYWNSYNVYGVCQCYIENQSCDNKNKCNCDSNDRITRTDSVKFNTKSHLPILAITAMDISSATGKSATITIGPLVCIGKGGILNAVTFQEIFSYLPILDINFANPGSLRFQFTTDRAQGNTMLFIQGRPQMEYLVIELTNSSAVTAMFAVGNHSYTICVKFPAIAPALNNLRIHNVYFQINALIAYLIVDRVEKSIPMIYQYDAPIEVNKDNTPFFLGGSPYSMFSGFKGSIRSLYVNGQMIDLLSIVSRATLATAGVYPTQFSTCIENRVNPCHAGLCVEHYNYYVCDCSYSPYYGKTCENEVGVIFDTPSSSLSYYINSPADAIDLSIVISFRTMKDGLLYMIQSSDSNIFLSLDIYKGNIRMQINLWQQRTTYPNIYMFYSVTASRTYADGKTHIVFLRMEGNYFIVVIDGLEIDVFIPILNTNVAIFKSPQWVYLGNAKPPFEFPSLSFSQFRGCLGGMKLKLLYVGKVATTDIDVLKALTSGNTNVIGSDVRSGTCVGNLTASAPAMLIPTPPNMIPGGGSMPQQLQSNGYINDIPVYGVGISWSPVIAAMLILLLFILILGSLLALRWYSRNYGVYMTEEGQKLNQTAERVQSKKREKLAAALPSVTMDDIEGWYL